MHFTLKYACYTSTKSIFGNISAKMYDSTEKIAMLFVNLMKFTVDKFYQIQESINLMYNDTNSIGKFKLIRTSKENILKFYSWNFSVYHDNKGAESGKKWLIAQFYIFPIDKIALPQSISHIEVSVYYFHLTIASWML